MIQAFTSNQSITLKDSARLIAPELDNRFLTKDIVITDQDFDTCTLLATCSYGLLQNATTLPGCFPNYLLIALLSF